MVLPHSTASLERLFSLFNHFKTKTNSLIPRLLRKSCWQNKRCQEASKTVIGLLETQLVTDVINRVCHQPYTKFHEQRKSDPKIDVHATDEKLEEEL